jgi:hypothetical protein
MQVDGILIYRTVQHWFDPLHIVLNEYQILKISAKNYGTYLSNVLILDCFCQCSLLQIRDVYPGSHNNNKYEGEKFVILPLLTSYNLHTIEIFFISCSLMQDCEKPATTAKLHWTRPA